MCGNEKVRRGSPVEIIAVVRCVLKSAADRTTRVKTKEPDLITRRTAASLIGALPLAARNMGQSAKASGPPIGVTGGQEADQCTGVPRGPKMQEWEAARIAVKNPTLREIMKSEFYSRHRVIDRVDPDIEVYRSWSPMAKIAFQRQRNVEREFLAMTSEPGWNIWGRVSDVIRNLMWPG